MQSQQPVRAQSTRHAGTVADEDTLGARAGRCALSRLPHPPGAGGRSYTQRRGTVLGPRRAEMGEWAHSREMRRELVTGTVTVCVNARATLRVRVTQAAQPECAVTHLTCRHAPGADTMSGAGTALPSVTHTGVPVLGRAGDGDEVRCEADVPGVCQRSF